MSELKINIEAMSLGDLELLDKWSKGEARITEVLNIFEKIMDDNPRDLPITALGDIVQAITDAIGGAQNPKN